MSPDAERFAQSIRAALSTAALVAYYLGAPAFSWVLVAMITAAAFLESRSSPSVIPWAA